MGLFGKREQQASHSSPGETFDITISPSAGARSLQFRISRRWVVAGLVAAGVIVLTLIATLLSAGYLLRQGGRVRELRAENVQLRSQLGRLNELESRIQQLDATRRSLMRIVGVEDPEDRPGNDRVEGQKMETPDFAYARAEPDTFVQGEATKAMAHALRHVPLDGPLTRGFGRLGDSGIFHTGIDIAGETGAAVHAAGEGVVSFVGWDEAFGWVLVIAHSARLGTMYGHNSAILVRVGDSIAAGQPVAEVGSTGLSSAPHLHFEVHWVGKAIDPALVFPAFQQDHSFLEGT